MVKKKKKKTLMPVQVDVRDTLQTLGIEDPLEEGIAIHCSILAWRIPRTEKPGRLQSLGRKNSDMI